MYAVQAATGREDEVRVGVTGYAHEVNGFASPVTRAHGIEASRTHGGLAATWEAGPAIATLVAAGVEPVDLPVWEFGASGPLDGDDFRALVAEVDDALVAAGPLDAVLVLGHGAGRTTDDLDPDATFLRAVRRRVGPVPVVVVLDFHANVTPAMCASVDGVVGYRTNPHVDIAERVADAAAMVVHLLGGGRTSVVAQQVPMVLPQIAQLTASHEPFGEVMLLAEQALRPPMRNVSVFGGFSLADVACQGASVCVTVDRGDEAAAIGVVRTLAAALWSRRDRYRLHATPLDEAIAVAARAAGGDGPPVLLADVADNPGGGAPATSTHVLEPCSMRVSPMPCSACSAIAGWSIRRGRRASAPASASPSTATIRHRSLRSSPSMPRCSRSWTHRWCRAVACTSEPAGIRVAALRCGSAVSTSVSRRRPCRSPIPTPSNTPDSGRPLRGDGGEVARPLPPASPTCSPTTGSWKWGRPGRDPRAAHPAVATPAAPPSSRSTTSSGIPPSHRRCTA
ncbi:MAG: M81 family metallopeptidase [Ilumatobacteraceae bacterium]